VRAPRLLPLVWSLALQGAACGVDSPPAIRALVPPFPSDLFTAPDPAAATGLRVDLEAVGSPLLEPTLSFGLWDRRDLVAWAGARDGFSSFGPIYMLLGGPLAGSPPAPDDLLLVELERGEHWGERTPFEARATEVEDPKLGPIRVLELRPTVPLRPASLHGVVLLRRAGERPLPQSDHFAALSGVRPLDAASALAPHLARARERAWPLLDYLHQQGIRREAVAEGFVFTTQSASLLLPALRHYLDSAAVPAPAVRWLGVYAPAELPGGPAGVAGLGSLAAVVKGELDAPDVRDVEGGVTLPLRAGRMLRVPFLLALPAAATSARLPLVIFQHGHGGRKELLLHVAPALAERGIATVAIDHFEHGELVERGLFFDLIALPRTGGNFVQTIVDGLRLVQALRGISSVEAKGRTFLLARDRWLGYLGESLGSISGVGLASAEPEVRAAVFNVAAAGLATSLAGAFLEAMSQNQLLLKLGSMAVLQLLLDPVDPVNGARRLWQDAADGARRTEVLMQNVVGDKLGVSSAGALAAALGAAYVCPCPAEAPLPGLARRAAPAPAPGLFFYSRGKHGFLVSESSDPAATVAVRRQAAHFLERFFSTGAGTIIDPWTP
jgi:dienelactone hydrolase